MVGPRTICLLCSTENCDDQVNLCVNCCIDVSVRVRGFTHSPLHDMVQVRRVIHDRDLASLAMFAKEAVDRGKFAISSSSRSKQLPVEVAADVDVDPKWHCSCCDDPIYMPCWFCMTCGTSGYYLPHYAINTSSFTDQPQRKKRSFAIPAIPQMQLATKRNIVMLTPWYD